MGGQFHLRRARRHPQSYLLRRATMDAGAVMITSPGEIKGMKRLYHLVQILGIMLVVSLWMIPGR